MSKIIDIDESAGVITEAGMRRIHTELDHWAKHFLHIADAMRLKKIPQLTDQNAKTLMRSIGYIRGAAKQARFAFDESGMGGAGVAIPAEQADKPKKGRKKNLGRDDA